MKVECPALQAQALKLKSVISEGLSEGKYNVREVNTSAASIAHVAFVSNVLYHSALNLQIIEGCYVPVEGIIDPFNLGYFKEHNKGLFVPASPVQFFDAEVCIISNLFSTNFWHFTEELFKILILEKAGFSGLFVYTELPQFAFEYLDTMGVDRRRLIKAPNEPVVFRSVVYTTNLYFADLSTCPDIFFELRERMLTAATAITSPYGKRLWLDRGVNANRPGQLVNSEEVEACLKCYGFTHLDIGSLPLLQQVAASLNADVIAGPHGGAFLHCMYMKPESTVVEVFSPYYLMGGSFEICRLLRHQYNMIVAYNSPQYPYRYGQDVYVDCRPLRLALQKLE